MTPRPRYTGSLTDWSGVAMATWLREAALREADAALDRARWLEADGETHLRVLSAYAGAENLAADHPDAQAAYAAHVDAYATRHGLRGWYRRVDSRGRTAVQVNHLRTPADGGVGRYFAYRSDPGAVVDRDSGAVLRFTGPRAAEMAQSWIYTAESGGC